MDGQPNLTDLRRRLAVIQEELKTDVETRTEPVSVSGLAQALSDVFEFMDELAMAIEEVQSHVRQ